MDYSRDDIRCAWTAEEDANEIVTLFNSADPSHTRTTQYWQWSHTATPFGSGLSAVAKTTPGIIAHYSLMPLNFSIKGKIYKLKNTIHSYPGF